MKRELVGLAAAMLMLGGAIFEQQRLHIVEEMILVPHLPASWNGRRIVQISDLHNKEIGGYFSRIVGAVRSCAPDTIFLTGDLVNRDTDVEKAEPKLRYLLRALVDIAPVYAIWGNHELGMRKNFPHDFDKLWKLYRETGVTLLDNESVELDGVTLTGITGDLLNYRNEKNGFSGIIEYTPGDMIKAVGFSGDNCNLVLAHNPLYALSYAIWGADLTLSGHMHGGLVKLPKLGGILSPERKLFPKFSSGKYEVDDMVLYVSAGIGLPRGVYPSEINLLTLVRRRGEKRTDN